MKTFFTILAIAGIVGYTLAKILKHVAEAMGASL